MFSLVRRTFFSLLSTIIGARKNLCAGIGLMTWTWLSFLDFWWSYLQKVYTDQPRCSDTQPVVHIRNHVVVESDMWRWWRDRSLWYYFGQVCWSYYSSFNSNHGCRVNVATSSSIPIGWTKSSDCTVCIIILELNNARTGSLASSWPWQSWSWPVSTLSYLITSKYKQHQTWTRSTSTRLAWHLPQASAIAAEMLSKRDAILGMSLLSSMLCWNTLNSSAMI